MRLKEITLSFQIVEKLHWSELQNFMELFELVYRTALPATSILSDTQLVDESINPELVSEVQSQFRIAAINLHGLSSKKPWVPEEGKLEIRKISFNSPLEFIVYGVVPALVVSIIISGGKIDLAKGKFEVKSLGSGLKKLREAASLRLGNKKLVDSSKKKLK